MAYKPSKKSILFYYVGVAERPNAVDCKSAKPPVRIRLPTPSFVRVLAREITLLRLLRRTDVVKGFGFESQHPKGASSKGGQTGSIPSDVPSPARVYYTGEWFL